MHVDDSDDDDDHLDDDGDLDNDDDVWRIIRTIVNQPGELSCLHRISPCVLFCPWQPRGVFRSQLCV